MFLLILYECVGSETFDLPQQDIPHSMIAKLTLQRLMHQIVLFYIASLRDSYRDF